MEKTKTCNTCTRRLVELAYQKSIFFRFLREPLKIIMRTWVKLKNINIDNYIINSENCTNCNRFYKNALKDNSKTFVWLNKLINPLFDSWMEKIVSIEEIDKAKKHSKALINGSEVPNGWNIRNNINKWKKL